MFVAAEAMKKDVFAIFPARLFHFRHLRDSHASDNQRLLDLGPRNSQISVPRKSPNNPARARHPENVFREMLRFRSPRARRHTKRLGRFQILDDRAEVDGLWVKSLIFRDFGAIQNLETVALEHLFAAPAFKRHDLPVNTFFAATIEITQIRAHQRAGRRHFSSVRKKIDVKMWNPPRRDRHFSPTVHQGPSNKSPRGLVIPEITGERFEKERNVLPERIELIEQRFARTEQITPDLAVDLNHERRFRFPIRIVSREKIGEQLLIFVDWIDWRSEKPRLTT